MAVHLPYGGSTIARAMRCRASARAAQSAPKVPESVYAKEGTIAHALLERAIKEGMSDVGFLIGVDPDVTRDMADAVNMVLEHIREDVTEGKIVLSERFARFPGFEEIAGGTADVQIIREHAGGTNEIVDFKFGFNPVEADDPQMAFYAICVFGCSDAVVTTVAQPRAFHSDGPVRSHVWTADALKSFAAQVAVTIEEAEAELAPYNPSAKACHHCPAASICPALEAHSLSVPALRNVRSLARHESSLPAPGEIGMDRAVYVMQMADTVRTWLAAVEEWVFAQAMSGAEVPGFKLVEKNARRKYVEAKRPEDTAKILADASGLPIEDFLRVSVVPLTEAQAMIKGALIETGVSAKRASSLAKSVMAFAVERPKTPELTMVPLSDDRAAVNRAARDFAAVNYVFRTEDNG